MDSPASEVLLTNNDVKANLLKPNEIVKKSRSFTRFDHSVVVIELERFKVTTSLEQALIILEKYYDRFK